MKNKLIALAVLLLGQTSIRAQAADPNKPCPSEEAQGFKPIFDGSVDSFRNNFVDYQSGSETNTNLSSSWQLDAADKAIQTPVTNDTRSKFKIHTNPGFDIRWSYRCPGNEGVVYLMTVAGPHGFNTGVEFAIDNRTDENSASPGAAFDIFPPSPNTYNLFNTGKWNDARIVAVGDSVEHWMNGKKVLGYKYHNQRFWDAYNQSKWNAGNQLTNKISGQRGALGQGYITDGYWGFQANHGGAWWIRSLRIDTVSVALGEPKNNDWQMSTTACSAVTGLDKAGQTGKYSLPAVLPAVHQTPSEVSVSFARLPLREATLVSLDGRATYQAVLAEASTRAVFLASLSPGIYLLKARDTRSQVVRKVRIF